MSVPAGSVLAVILNWNRCDLSLTCVKHVLAQKGAKADVVVIDNGSSDDSVARIARSGLEVKTIALHVNAGFAAGMNHGIQHALDGAYEYVWLINNDAFVAPDCLQTLLQLMERDSDLAMVSPRLLSPDGTEQHAGGLVDCSTAALHYLRAGDLAVPAGGRRWLSGTVLLIRASAVAKVGMFEPAFFAYWEDVDLSTRLIRSGEHLAAVPDAVATHIGSATSGGQSSMTAQFLMTRNAWLFIERNSIEGSPRRRWLRFVSSELRRAMNLEPHGSDPALAQAALAGLTAARRHQYGSPPSYPTPALFERLLYRTRRGSGDVMARVAAWVDTSTHSR